MPVLVEAKHASDPEPSEGGYIVKQQLGNKVMMYREYIPLNEYGVYYSVNVYAMKYKNTVVLIDAGHESLAEQLYDNVMSDFNKKEMVVILTHAHADHAGGGKYLQEQGATVYVHPNDQGIVQLGYEDPTAPDAFKYTGYTATPLPMGMDPISFMGFEINWTPGHTMGSISLYNAKVDGLFTGDLFITLGEAETEYDYTSYIVYATLQSHQAYPILLTTQLNSISSLDTDVTTLYTGHYGPYQGDSIGSVVGATVYAINNLL